jgi:ATPase subunit of ABC transporter with duplicated ATPase domains
MASLFDEAATKNADEVLKINAENTDARMYRANLERHEKQQNEMRNLREREAAEREADIRKQREAAEREADIRKQREAAEREADIRKQREAAERESAEREADIRPSSQSVQAPLPPLKKPTLRRRFYNFMSNLSKYRPFKKNKKIGGKTRRKKRRRSRKV